jgi:hypothetical protein
MSRTFTRVLFLEIIAMVALGVFALAQQAPPSIPSTGHPEIDQYRASRIAIYTDDFGQLARYRAEDAALATTATNENRVVFLGDSITDYWKLADYFLASHTSSSIAASTGRARLKCWYAFARM